MCSLGSTGSRAERSRSVQNLCNNQRAKTNRTRLGEASRRFGEIVKSTVYNEKLDTKEALEFLASTPGAVKAFRFPGDDSEFRIESDNNEEKVLRIFNTIQYSLDSTEGQRRMATECKSSFSSASFINNNHCVNPSLNEVPSIEELQLRNVFPPRVFKDAILSACGRNPLRVLQSAPTGACERDTPEELSEYAFDKCMQGLSSRNYRFDDSDYKVCYEYQRNQGDAFSLEECKEGIDRAREEERQRLTQELRPKCQAIKEKTLIKCQTQQRKAAETKRRERENYVKCANKARDRYIEKHRETLLENKRAEQRAKLGDCNKSLIRDSLCAGKDAPSPPLCSGNPNYSSQCSRLVLNFNYQQNKKNFQLIDGDTEREKINKCIDVHNFSREVCEKFNETTKKDHQSITKLYTKDRMSKATAQFEKTRETFKGMISSWRESGKISQQKYDTLLKRISNSNLEIPRSPAQLRSIRNNKAQCECHAGHDQKGDFKECESNSIYIGPELILSMDTEAGQQSLLTILSHEMGHSLAPNMSETEDIFDGVSSCLSKRLSTDKFFHKNKFIRRQFLRESISDWIAAEAISFERDNYPSDRTTNEGIRESLETTMCGVLGAGEMTNNKCRYRDGKYLYPKEAPVECLDSNANSTYPIIPDRLSIFTENPRFKQALGCSPSESRPNSCSI